MIAERRLSAVSTLEREGMREVAPGKPVMRQTWLDLVFLHYPLEPEQVQEKLPPGLTVDTFPDDSGREMAWIGLVAFRIEGIKLFGLPSLPGLGAFNEVNVRTYAHINGREPSVYFFSLDGGPWPTRVSGNLWYKVNYYRSTVRHIREKNRIRYESRRPRSGASCSVDCQTLPLHGSAEEGSLERFLTDRYQLYSFDGTRIWKARVSHQPYELGGLVSYAQTDLPEAAGLQKERFTHACWCSKVEAAFYAPTLATP